MYEILFNVNSIPSPQTNVLMVILINVNSIPSPQTNVLIGRTEEGIN